MMGEKRRLFLAVNLNILTTRRIADAIGRMRPVAERRGLKVGWVPAANLHVTLKFLGWTSSEVVEAVQDRVAAAVKGVRPFDVGARGSGAYPSLAGARILWVGVHDGSGALAQLAARVEAAVAALGFAPEARPFSPHLTIGRVKGGEGAEEVLSGCRSNDFGNSSIREVVLYESLMRSSGSEYLALARIPLEGGSGRPERQTRGVETGEPGRPESEDPNGGQHP